MSAGHDNADHDMVLDAHGDTVGHGSMRSYLVGFVLSVVLTAVPFWAVMNGAATPDAAAVLIIGCAVLQILVHTICFLHVNTRSEGGWTLVAYVFTAVLLLILIAGSLWIMYHMNTNMMPGMMPGEVSYTP